MSQGRDSKNPQSFGKTKLGSIAGIIVVVLALLFGRGNLDNIFSGQSETSTSVQTQTSASVQTQTEASAIEKTYHFRNNTYLTEHFEKHGSDFDYATAQEYEAGASAVVNSKEALHKTEAEDGDDVYYIERTNEFVIVSTDGYIRTYFKPESGIKYYNRQ